MKIVAITCSVVMWLTSIFSISVPIPYLPYVPPHDAQLWDLVFNVFGITAPDIEDAEERAAAYWNIYRDALGAGYDAFEQDMRDAFDTAKTGGALIIGAGMGVSLEALQVGMEKSLNEGIMYGGDIVNPTDIQKAEKLKMDVLKKWNVNMSVESAMQVIQSWYNSGFPYAVFRKGNDNWGVAFPWQYYKQNGYVYIVGHFGWQEQNVTDINSFSRYGNTPMYNNNDVAWSSIENCIDLGAYSDYAVTARVANVAAQSAAVAAAIGARTLIPVTAETVLNNGVIDDTKPVKIKLPLSDLPVGAREVGELAGVQDKVDAVPNAEIQDLAETIEELQEKQAATYGDTGAFSVDLTSYFPFCIPFDLYKMLLALGAEPEAPSIDFPMITGMENGQITTVNLHISLEFMDNLMQLVRTGELIFATLGLAMLTAKVIKW